MQVTEPKKMTYVTLLADESIHPKYEAALKEVERDFGKHYQMFIGGKPTSSGAEFELRSPIDTGILLGFFQKGTAEFARKAIDVADEAFMAWSSRPWPERISIARKIAEIIRKKQFYLAALITYEVGKNRYEAIAEVNEAADFFDYYARQMEENHGYVRP